jgi:hypothetical protein
MSGLVRVVTVPDFPVAPRMAISVRRGSLTCPCLYDLQERVPMGQVDYRTHPLRLEFSWCSRLSFRLRENVCRATYSHSQRASFDPFVILRVLILNGLPIYCHRVFEAPASCTSERCLTTIFAWR